MFSAVECTPAAVRHRLLRREPDEPVCSIHEPDLVQRWRVDAHDSAGASGIDPVHELASAPSTPSPERAKARMYPVS